MEELKSLAEFASEACRRAGASDADAFLTKGVRLSVDIYKSEPETFERAETGGAGLRTFRNGRMGYAYTTDLTEQGLEAAAKVAYDNAAAADGDEFNGLPAEAGLPAAGSLSAGPYSAEALGLVTPEFETATVDDKIRFALAMEKEAATFDRRIKGCESVTYGEEDAYTAIANTGGFLGFYRKQICYGFIDVLAGENGEVQTGFSYSAGRSLKELDAKEAGREAAEKAISMLGAVPMKPETLTAVFDPLVFIQVLAALTPALSAEASQKGRSFLSGAVGSETAAKTFSLLDDGRLLGGLGSAPFDDEGVPTRETSVIDKGVLRTLLYNSYAARKESRLSTGNASRGSFRTPPGTAPTNLYIKPGKAGKDAIIGSVESGLYVLGLQGLHAGVSPVTGQFSAGAYGLRIRNGRLAEPVREITIATTCAELLKNVEAVGSDLRFIPMGAAYGSPTVAVADVVVSGRG